SKPLTSPAPTSRHTMKVHTKAFKQALLLASMALFGSDAVIADHNPEKVLYRKTNNLPAADFTGALPENVDQLPPLGDPDDP
ncbi:MAG: hypothetical protein MK312_05320, partial [Roseibacillus sp.]|nr:hypothetical protein [Roseibacillus sp.]